MQLLVYISPFNPLNRDLLSAVDLLGAHIGHTYVSSIESLMGHLRRPLAGQSICILAPSSQAELITLINQRHLMRDCRIILVLPEGNHQMLADGHLLRPRFISQKDRGFSEVMAGVDRMVRRRAAEWDISMQRACAGVNN